MIEKKDLPIISFITPNYNDGKSIGKLVESIYDQDWPAKEMIIVDDGSTDNSKEVLEKLKIKYPKLKVIFLEENKGACVARNVGAKEARGKYLSFLPADAKLYPGMARIWVEALERHPEYDFIYGGYKFVDEEGHEMFAYLGDDFDPYFLQVTNYIDGSFPLKKELFDKMGGWDPQIKSLQDWDFWLNAVINCGAKGFYSKQVFFETTYPHAGGLSDDSHRNWLARMEQIKNKYGIPLNKICVTGPGASFHARNVAKIIGADYLPMPSFKPHRYEMIYTIGFFGDVAKGLANTNCLRVLHWIGSDILAIQQAKPDIKAETIKWIDNNIDINLCEMEATRKELEDLGIKARIVPFPPQRIYEPLPLPEKFSVAVYLPYNNAEFYYPSFIREVAEKMPDVHFFTFGNPMRQGTKGNVTDEGVLNKEEMEQLIKKTSCLVRLTPHDGLPLSVIEWLTAGRQAITTVDIPYTTRFTFKKWDRKRPPDKKELDRVIEKNRNNLIKLIRKVKNKKVDLAGSEYYRKLCDPKVFKNTIHNLLNLDIKDWWKNISDLWPDMESAQETTEDIGKIIKKIKELKPENIIDLGCGTGRWIDLLPVDDYTGIDFMESLIDMAKEKHPDSKFIADDILEYAAKVEKKYDLAFSFVSFLHIKPKDIKQYVEAIKKIAKRGVFIEPIREVAHQGQDRIVHPKIIEMQKKTDFVFNVKYTWIHDYLNLFNCVEVIPMSHNRNMFVVDLE